MGHDVVEVFNLGRDIARLSILGFFVEIFIINCKRQADTNGRYIVNRGRPTDLDADEAVDHEATPPHTLAYLLLDNILGEVGRIEIEPQLLCCADCQPNNGPTMIEFQ